MTMAAHFLLGVSAESLCAGINEDADRIGRLDDMVAVANKVGLRLSKHAVYKAQMAGEGPPRVIFSGHSVYRVRDFLTWALGRVQRAEDGPAARGARARRANAAKFVEPIAA
jgi:hypothetical protein